MKKGFTLVELLAVIVILAIILAIAVPSITSIIENSQINAFKSNERMLLKAAKTYVEVNDSGLPVNIGDTTEISLETLQINKYISTIASPGDKTKDCNGYVIITKIDESNYDYTPHLNCQSDIGSSSEDGLIAHYKFDDFQEPTVNILPNPPLDVTFQTSGSWYAYSGASATVTQNVDVPEWGTTKATRIQLSGGTNYLKFLTQGIAPAQNGVPYTSQVKIKNIGAKTCRFNTQYGMTVDVHPGESKSVVVSILGNGTTNFQMRFQTLAVSDSLDIIVYQPQIEKKSYNTPFVAGTRDGIVKDYSSNGNHASLALSTTPKWSNNSKVGTGTYEFDGSNDVIYAGNDSSLNITDFITLSAWVKTGQQNSSFNGIVSKSQSNSNGWEFRTTNNYDVNGTGVQFRLNGDNGATGTVWLNNGEWYHLVGTYDGVVTKFYVNGILEMSKPYSSNIFTNSIDLQIGKLGYTNLYFKGSIDEVRIYNRVLSTQEIKNLYEITK